MCSVNDQLMYICIR